MGRLLLVALLTVMASDVFLSTANATPLVVGVVPAPGQDIHEIIEGVTTDLFDVAQGTVVTSSSTLFPTFDAQSALGYVKPTSIEPSRAIFSDSPIPTDFIEFHTNQPINLGYYRLFLGSDEPGRWADGFRLYASSNSGDVQSHLVSSANIAGPYVATYGSPALQISDTLNLFNVQFFRMEIDRGAFSGSSGPRVIELDGFSIPEPPAVGAIYWTDIDGPSGSHVIRRANADGSGVQTVVTGLRDPRGMTIDFHNEKMYWTEPGNMSIRRANLDGSEVESVVATSDLASGVALDPLAGKLYWTDGIPGAGLIKRANFDGSGIESLVTGGPFHPVGIALDLIQQKMYWTDLEGNLDGNGKIQRSNLDGSNIETLLTGIDEANGLTIDPIHGKIYWTELATNRIQRANLDGSNLEDIVTGLETPTTIDVDLSANKIYWSDGHPDGNQLNRIERANLDGSGREVVVSGVGFPWGIALGPGLPVPEPSSLALFSLACLMVGARRVTPRRLRIPHRAGCPRR